MAGEREEDFEDGDLERWGFEECLPGREALGAELEPLPSQGTLGRLTDTSVSRGEFPFED